MPESTMKENETSMRMERTISLGPLISADDQSYGHSCGSAAALDIIIRRLMKGKLNNRQGIDSPVGDGSENTKWNK